MKEQDLQVKETGIMSDYRVTKIDKENIVFVQDIIDPDVAEMLLLRRDTAGIMAVSEDEDGSVPVGVLIYRIFEEKHTKSKQRGCELKYLYVRDAYRHEGTAIMLMNILKRLMTDNSIPFIEVSFPVCPQFMELDDFLSGYGFETDFGMDTTLKISLNEFEMPSNVPEPREGLILSFAELGADESKKYLSELLSVLDDGDYDPLINEYDHSYFMEDTSFCYIKKDKPVNILLMHKKPSGVVSVDILYSDAGEDILLKMIDNAKKNLYRKDRHTEIEMENLDPEMFEFINEHLKMSHSYAVVKGFMGI